MKPATDSTFTSGIKDPWNKGRICGQKRAPFHQAVRKDRKALGIIHRA